MTLLNNGLKRASGAGSAAIGILLLTATASFACAVPTPTPLIGVTGPYGIAAAAVAYGGFLIYRKLKNRS